MPRNLKPLLLIPTSRFQVDIIVQIGIQRGYNLQELSYQPVEENTDSLTASWRVMKLMILGIRILLLMSWGMSTTTPTT